MGAYINNIMNMKKTIFFDRKLRIKYKLFEKKKKIYTYISKEVGKEILPLLHKKNLTGLNFSLEDQLFSSSSNNFLVDFRLLREGYSLLRAKPAKQGSFTLAREALGKKKEPKLIVPFQGANETINRPEATNIPPMQIDLSALARTPSKEPDSAGEGVATPTLARGGHTEKLRDENANSPWAHQRKYKDNVFSYMVFNNLERIFKKLEKKKLFFYTRKLPTSVKVKNRCLLSSGSRSIYSKLRLGRQSLKKEIHLGSLPSFTKASF